MRRFKSNDNRGGFRGDREERGGFRGGRNDRGDRGERQMFKTTCSDCGSRCEVPFKPSGDKPVYCNDCFQPDNGGNSRDSRFERNERRSPQRGGRDEYRSYDRDNRKQMYETVCDECGDECQVPFSPSGDKPVYCDECFSITSKNPVERNAATKADIQMLSDKLDRVMKVLVSLISGQTESAVPLAQADSEDIMSKVAETQQLTASEIDNLDNEMPEIEPTEEEVKPKKTKRVSKKKSE